jgi:hypothetical protein
MKISAGSADPFTIRGSFFCSQDPAVDSGQDSPAVALLIGGYTLPCQLPNPKDPNRDMRLLVSVPAGLAGKVDANNPTPMTLRITRGDNASTDFAGLSAVS